MNLKSLDHARDYTSRTDKKDDTMSRQDKADLMNSYYKNKQHLAGALKNAPSKIPQKMSKVAVEAKTIEIK